MKLAAEIKEAFLHYLFPHVCEGCGTDVLNFDHSLCLPCLAFLPKTSFQYFPNNPVEKMFWGRMPITSAAALFYFAKETGIQHMLHQVKYRGNKTLGLYLGSLMGNLLAESNRFRHVDALVPLPLFKTKERKRGYNQAELLCQGMASVWDKPVLNGVVERIVHTQSQTKMNRVERWMNMEGKFQLINPQLVQGKHLLLIDDVITTGATLEACGSELLLAENVQLSIATLCFSNR